MNVTIQWLKSRVTKPLHLLLILNPPIRVVKGIASLKGSYNANKCLREISYKRHAEIEVNKRVRLFFFFEGLYFQENFIKFH